MYHSSLNDDQYRIQGHYSFNMYSRSKKSPSAEIAHFHLILLRGVEFLKVWVEKGYPLEKLERPICKLVAILMNLSICPFFFSDPLSQIGSLRGVGWERRVNSAACTPVSNRLGFSLNFQGIVSTCIFFIDIPNMQCNDFVSFH